MPVERREHFRMPLKSHHKRMTLAFNSLDQTIFSGCIDDQARADLFNRLVVRGVYFNGLSPQNLSQPGAWMDNDPMASTLLFITLLMVPGVGQLSCNVLVERAAQDNIDCLLAAA